MDFSDNNKAIYLQIADKICDDIMSGVYQLDGRMPSVREYAASVQVNANTVMRTYDYLSQAGIIQNKRGIGYFVSPGAKESITALRNETFFSTEMKYFFSRLSTIGLSPEKLTEMYKKYLSNQSK